MTKTAYLFDEIYMEHDTGWGHPECPERLNAIDNKIRSMPYYKELLEISPSMPDMKYIEMIHSKSYIKETQRDIEKGKKYLDSGDTCVCNHSYNAALLAVGGCINMCDAVMNGDAQNGFCAVRPPGHHAERDYASGFCIFNNIAIAAKYLQDKHGLKNIAIVDWDVHHGNGTQHSFEKDDTILYISLHQYPHYPGTGNILERGKGIGEGYTLNIPMNAGANDSDYINMFNKHVTTALDKFKPEIILISAGFDAHKSDPLSSIRISTDTFGVLTEILMNNANKHSNGKIIAFLEGGYNLDALANSVEKVIDKLVNKKE